MSFFSGFDFSGNKARRDIERANSQATAALDRGYGQQTQAYEQAGQMFNPYIAEGRQGSQMYNSLMGLNGTDAAGTAYETLAGLPAFSGKLALDSNAVLKNLNARGMGAGGTAAIAGQRVLQENIGNWLDRYRDQGRQGFEATNQGAGVRMNVGDNALGYAATKANQGIQYGNALASTRNTGLNNLIGLAGVAGRTFNAFRK